MTEFAALVKQERERQGIRAYDLAFKLEQTPSWVSRLESGDMANPPTPTLMAKLSEELGLSERRMLRSLGYLSTETETPEDTIDMFDPLDQQLVRLMPLLGDRDKEALLSYAQFLGRSDGAKAWPEDVAPGVGVPMGGGKGREAQLVRRTG